MVPELTTEWLLLQSIKPEDQSFIFEGLSDPEVISFYGVRYESLEATGAQMEWYKMMEEEGSGTSWKMVEKVSGAKMGVISVYFYKPEHNKAELGFWLLPDYWNKGFASEALVAVIAYWKEEKALHRLEAFVEEGNHASSKLLERAGFLYEGTMRDCEIKDGRYISLLIYALIPEEKITG
jgi:[ribosomal protein S5]-alanine N-acetyltransferase